MGVGIDDVDARLERAKENIANLASEIKELLPDGCDERAIPARFTVLAGESIYLMRSALDHLAWHLVIAAGGEPGPRTAFPVFALDPARNAESLVTYAACVAGMSDSAKVRIERLQPYHRHGLRKQNVLWILNDLSSTDQHTALALRINTYPKQRNRPFRTGETLQDGPSADGNGARSIAGSRGGAAATHGNSQDGEGAAYLSFVRFGKLTDVGVVDGLWLLWHATHGIYASFAEELMEALSRSEDRNESDSIRQTGQ